MKNHQLKILPLLVLVLLISVITQTIHEAGHWIVYQSLGHKPVWGFIGLVQIWGMAPQNPDDWVEVTSPSGEEGWLRLLSDLGGRAERAAAAAGGPLTSLFGAVVGLTIMGRSKNSTLKKVGLAMALTTSFVMVFYYLRSPLRTGGDEHDLAIQVGLARPVIELAFASAFAVCLGLGLHALETWRIKFKWLRVIFLGGIPAGLLINLADNLVRSQVNAENPFFRSLFGFSLPILLINGLVLIGLWLWFHYQDREKDSK